MKEETVLCRSCGLNYAEDGDGYDGECPSCADKTAAAEAEEMVEDAKAFAHPPSPGVYYFEVRVGIRCDGGASQAREILGNAAFVLDLDEDESAVVVDYEVTGGAS